MNKIIKNIEGKLDVRLTLILLIEETYCYFFCKIENASSLINLTHFQIKMSYLT